MKKKKKESEEKQEVIVYLIRISEKEFKNSRIRKAVFDLIDTKIREQRGIPFIVISQSEYDFLSKHKPGFFVPWKKYSKSKRGLVYEGEVGKYLGKRLIVK